MTPPGPPIRPQTSSAPAEAPRPQPAVSSRTPIPVKTRGALFGDLLPIPTDPAIDPPPHHCFNCWQDGHSRTVCTRPVRTNFCYNCGRRGESLTTCPRCAHPHRLHMEGRAIAIRNRPSGQREERAEGGEPPRGAPPARRTDDPAGVVEETLRAVGTMPRREGEEVEVTVVKAVLRGRSPTRRR